MIAGTGAVIVPLMFPLAEGLELCLYVASPRKIILSLELQKGGEHITCIVCVREWFRGGGLSGSCRNDGSAGHGSERLGAQGL